MMLHLCVVCKTEMRCEKNDFMVEQRIGNDESSRPYRLWATDKWKCHTCGAEFVPAPGVGQKPYDAADRPGYEERRLLREPDLIVLSGS